MGVEVEYRPAPDYEGYRVGNDGSVWTCLKQRGNKPSIISDTWRPLKCWLRPDGYRAVALCHCGRRRDWKVASLVLTVFIGPRPKGMHCCHNNGISTDDRLVNLRWDTPKGNIADTKKHGTCLFGERNPVAVLTEDLIRVIACRNAAGESIMAIAKDLGFLPCTVYAVVNGISWKRLDGLKWAKKKGRLTDDQVRDIRKRVEEGVSQRELASEFGVHNSFINAIVHRKSYKNVT
jgi:hypothetical protein